MSKGTRMPEQVRLRKEITLRMLKAGAKREEIEAECRKVTGAVLGSPGYNALRLEVFGPGRSTKPRRKRRAKPSAAPSTAALVRLPGTTDVADALIRGGVPFVFDGAAVLMGGKR